MKQRFILAFALANALFAPVAICAEDAPASHTIKYGSLKTKLQFDAVFESTEMHPVKITPKSWSDFTVLDAVPHGSKVKKGDSLLTLDLEKIKEQIQDLEADQPNAVLTLELAEAELANLSQSTPIKLEAAKRSQRIADEDYSYFESIGRSQREKAAKFSIKNSEQRLANAKEELKQLQKMYKADDLTEETEEIILKRQQFAVESAQYFMDSARLSTERDLKTLIPREYETLKNQLRDQELSLTLSQETLPRALSKKRQEVEKLKRDQRKSSKKLIELKMDLEAMQVRAPAGGMLFYGASENGKWATAGTIAKKLQPNGKLSGNEVFMTVVNPDKLTVKAFVNESDLARYRTGLKGHITPLAAPDRKLPVRLEEISSAPTPAGPYEATLSVKLDKSVRVLPGMTGKVIFAEAPKPEALLAPKKSVFSAEGQSYVYLLREDGTHEKKNVKTGESDKTMTEIVDGLADGDRILLKKPADADSDTKAS